MENNEFEMIELAEIEEFEAGSVGPCKCACAGGAGAGSGV